MDIELAPDCIVTSVSIKKCCTGKQYFTVDGHRWILNPFLSSYELLSLLSSLRTSGELEAFLTLANGS